MRFPRAVAFRLVLILIAVQGVACSGNEPATRGAAASLADTVRSERPILQGAAGWSLGDTPLVTIGAANPDNPAYEFGQQLLLRLFADGGFVVGDVTHRELRYFDASGRHITTTGRRGPGPGEFELIQDVALGREDSVIVADASGRINVFSSKGALARSYASPFPIMRLVGVLDDRALAFAGGSWKTAPASGDLVSFAGAAIVTPSGDVQMTLDSLPHQRWFSRADFSGIIGFSPQGYGIARGKRIYWGHSESFVVSQYAVPSRTGRVMKRAWHRAAVTEADIAAYKASIIGPPDDPRDDKRAHPLARVLAGTPFAEWHPAYSGLLLDDAGYLWVREYRVEDRLNGEPGRAALSTAWSVFDTRDGRWLVDVVTPPGFMIMDIRAGRAAGVSRTENDVLQVQVYELRKPAHSGG